MSTELEYLKDRLDDVLKGQARLEKKVDISSAKFADKLDTIREAQTTQRAELTANTSRISEHDRVLVIGNGQPPLISRMAKAESRLDALPEESPKASAVKERLTNWGKVITVLGLIVSQALAWIFGLPK